MSGVTGGMNGILTANVVTDLECLLAGHYDCKVV